MTSNYEGENKVTQYGKILLCRAHRPMARAGFPEMQYTCKLLFSGDAAIQARREYSMGVARALDGACVPESQCVVTSGFEARDDGDVTFQAWSFTLPSALDKAFESVFEEADFPNASDARMEYQMVVGINNGRLHLYPQLVAIQVL